MFSYITHFQAFLLTEKRVTLNTYKAYTADIETFVLFLKHNTNVSTFNQLSAQEVDAFFKELKRRNFAQKSIMRFAATLRSLGKYVRDRYDITTALLEIKIFGAPKNLPRHCSEKDISFLLNSYCPIKNQRNNLIIHLLYSTGIRVSELCKIEVKDLDLQIKVVTIIGKRGKYRKIPLTDDLTKLLHTYITGTRLEKIAAASSYSIPFLFPIFRKGKGNPITRSMVWRIVKKGFLKEQQRNPSLMLQNAFPHLFRHALATHMVKHDWDLRSIQLLLGHENISTVEIYTHMDTSHIKNVYQKKHPRSSHNYEGKKEDL